jgi:hypothetical protein
MMRAANGGSASTPQHATCTQATSKGLLHDAYARGLLQKWDMLKGMRLQQYSYAGHYHRMNGEQLVLDLLNDPAARQHLQVAVAGGARRRARGAAARGRL